MENIYTARSVHPWLLFGGDFERRRAEVSHTLLHVRSWGKQALPLAGKAKKHKWKFSCLRQSDCWRLGAHCRGKQPALLRRGCTSENKGWEKPRAGWHPGGAGRPWGGI